MPQQTTNNFNEATNALNTITQNPQLFSSAAKVYRLLRESLIEENFTREEAVQIICSQNFFGANKKGTPNETN